MSHLPALAAALLLLLPAGQAAAQPVAVAPLAAPDAFSTAGRATGLPPNLWRGASAATARTVLPLLASKPLSPAAAALARRVLATGAPGPEGAEPALVGARAAALLAAGDAKAAADVLERAPGLDRNAEVSRAAAETALLTGDDARACAVAEALTVGREETYWLRLRAYCQAIAGQEAQAQLTFDLAQAQARDAVYGRLMTAKLAGSGNPGAASLRNGLDYALSRNLGLDLTGVTAVPAVAAARVEGDPAEPTWETAADLAGDPLDALLAADGDAKVKARAQSAALLLASLAGPLSPERLGQVAAISLPEGKAGAGRNLALDAAADQKLMGQTALLALWTSAEAGAAGPALGDRARIIRALRAVGLEADARNFAQEGLAALK
ncbi:MAG: hypothetical protein ABW360_16750 [Phenylobacterium sp.]